MQPLCDVTTANRFANEIKTKHDYYFAHNYTGRKHQSQDLNSEPIRFSKAWYLSLPLLSYLSLKRLKWSLVALPASVVYVIFPFIPPIEVYAGPASSRLRSLSSASYLSMACRQVCSSLLWKTDLVSQLLEAVSTQALSPSPQVLTHPGKESKFCIQFSKRTVIPTCSSHCSGTYATFQM